MFSELGLSHPVTGLISRWTGFIFSLVIIYYADITISETGGD